MIKCLVRECNANVNSESSVCFRQFLGMCSCPCVCVCLCVCVCMCMLECMCASMNAFVCVYITHY